MNPPRFKPGVYKLLDNTRLLIIHIISYFSGFKNRDVAFLHPASKTLVQADLLLNLPPTEQVSRPITHSPHISQ